MLKIRLYDKDFLPCGDANWFEDVPPMVLIVKRIPIVQVESKIYLYTGHAPNGVHLYAEIVPGELRL